MTDQKKRALRLIPTKTIPSLADDVRRGLLEPPRSMPPKHFYDEKGARLFEAITRTQEYYPTRAEYAVLRENAAAIIARTQPHHILELGSGSARKTRVLLEAALADTSGLVRYHPMDVSEEMLLESATELRETFSGLVVSPIVGDYSGGLGNLKLPGGPVLVLFLGGTIGNFDHAGAVVFLRELAAQMGPDDHFLLGLDMVKDTATLEAAYNDKEGVTARFNRNLLRVLNRELGANFDLESFRHRAIFNRDESQIEMYLVATRDMYVELPELGAHLELTEGEQILTEISRKFTREGGTLMLREGNLEPLQWFFPAPPSQRFGLVLASKVPG